MVDRFGWRHSDVIWREAAAFDYLQIFQWCVLRGIQVDYEEANTIALSSGGRDIADWLSMLM